MKTRINLYGQALKPVKEKLPLSLSVAVAVAVVLIMFSVSAVTIWLNNNQIASQEAARVTLNQEQQKLIEKSELLNKLSANQQLMDSIASVKEKIKNKKKIVATLEQRQEVDEGFTKLLLALAEISDQKVWLTDIKSEQGALTLSGRAQHSQDIPRWVAKLNRVESLQGATFSALSMERDDSTISFVLHNQAKLSESN